MDNVIRLSKFVKNLGIVTTVLFLIIVLVHLLQEIWGVRYVLCLLYF